MWCKCHHLKAHMISTSSYNALIMSCLLLAGKSVHALGHLSGGSCSEWSAKANALIGPSLWRGKWQIQAHTVTYTESIFKVCCDGLVVSKHGLHMSGLASIPTAIWDCHWWRCWACLLKSLTCSTIPRYKIGTVKHIGKIVTECWYGWLSGLVISRWWLTPMLGESPAMVKVVKCYWNCLVEWHYIK